MGSDGARSEERLKRGFEVSFYRLIAQLGEGGCGSVWKVIASEDGKYYAMKFEPENEKWQTLRFEVSVLRALQDSDRFPRYVLDGVDRGFYFLVEELLGPNIWDVVQALPAKSCATAYLARLADEMLQCVEAFHSHGYIHRDIKPQNFLTRLDGGSPIVLIDFGVSRLFRGRKGSEVADRSYAHSTGTPAYASRSSHAHAEQGRRDDLISWIYTVAALSSAGLPWEGRGLEETQRLKEQIALPELIRALGEGFVAAAGIVEGTRPTDTPDYAAIHAALAREMGATPKPFEWMGVVPLRSQRRTPRPGGSWDPTGFLRVLLPSSKRSGCGIA